jgi:hypothetical protein
LWQDTLADDELHYKLLTSQKVACLLKKFVAIRDVLTLKLRPAARSNNEEEVEANQH